MDEEETELFGPRKNRCSNSSVVTFLQKTILLLPDDVTVTLSSPSFPFRSSLDRFNKTKDPLRAQIQPDFSADDDVRPRGYWNFENPH